MEARNDSFQSTLTFLMDQVPATTQEKHIVLPPGGAQYFQTTTTSSPLNSGNQQVILNTNQNHVNHIVHVQLILELFETKTVMLSYLSVLFWQMK